MLYRSAFALAIILAGTVLQQGPVPFVIDETKPYVYLIFDHTAKRQQLSEGEDSTGLWLRLVNNCSVPISVQTFDTGKNDLGTGILDEIVMVSPSGSGHKHGTGVDETFRGNPPKAYSSDTPSFTVVPPGTDLLFSLPRNHVSRRWYLRIQFELQPPKKGMGPQPYSYVDFTWTMLPEKDRPVDHH